MTEKETDIRKRKPQLKQTDVPSCSLNQAIRIPIAIAENYASKPTTPLNVAAALEMQPTSGPFRMLCGASIAYGLTSGGYNANQIEITPLGLRIVRPLKEKDDIAAKCEAVLKPRVLSEFLKKYDGSPIPKESISFNVLEDMGVPRERAKEVLELIISCAEDVHFLKRIKDRVYVDLSGISASSMPDSVIDVQNPDDDVILNPGEVDDYLQPKVVSRTDEKRSKRVFITHGKDRSFLDPIKKLLSFGDFEAVISVDRQSVSKPVPEKVMSDMRSCGAAIIHVDADRVLMDKSAEEHILLNENVLIEIGASMALFGRRFILLVKEGVRLPSNLQGLYEVRYQGEALDGNATIKLLEAINDIKNHPIPTDLAI